MKLNMSFFILVFLNLISLEFSRAEAASTICDQVTEIPRIECDALVALYKSTNGASWHSHWGWNVFNKPCVWDGITCFNGHVHIISLLNNNLNGSIPSELGNLSNLEELYLPNNSLNGSIPSELGNLSNLKVLYLWGNSLSGSIPSELGELSNLLELVLDINKLSGEIPLELGKLSNLTLLGLGSNYLGGLIPLDIFELTKLTVLGLDDNHLIGSIPSELGKLIKLQRLFLSNNQLCGDIPSSLTNLSDLDLIELQNNALTITDLDPELEMFLDSISESTWQPQNPAPAVCESSSETGNIILWNKLGSESEVTHSEIGPNGEIVGEVLFEPGQYGNGFRSAIRTGDHNVPNNFIRFPNLQLGPQGCIEFWYHPDWKDSRVGHVIDIIQYGVVEKSSSKISLGFNDWQNRGDAQIRDYSSDGELIGRSINDFHPSSDPNWTTSKPIHIAITWDKSLGKDSIKLYFNGETTGEHTFDGNPQSSWSYDEPHYLYIGSRTYSGDWNRHHWEPNIDGVIDNVIVWNYAKTDFSHRFREKPSLISLDSFSVNTLENQVVIEWKTKTEIDNLGVSIWCAQIQGNQFQEITQLNSKLIPSKAIQPNYGASYSSTDYPYVNTNLKPSIQHCALEDIDASGQCTLHCDQIDTTVVGKDQNVTDIDLNELNAKAIALCHQYEDSLTEAGQGGVCLDQLLISREPRLIPYRR